MHKKSSSQRTLQRGLLQHQAQQAAAVQAHQPSQRLLVLRGWVLKRNDEQHPSRLLRSVRRRRRRRRSMWLSAAAAAATASRGLQKLQLAPSVVPAHSQR